MLHFMFVVLYACDDYARDIFRMHEDDVEIRVHEEERNNRVNLEVHGWVNAEWENGVRMVPLPADMEWWGDRPAVIPAWMLPENQVVLPRLPSEEDLSSFDSEFEWEADDVLDVAFEREFSLLARLFQGFMPDAEAERERREDERLEVAAVMADWLVLEQQIPDWYDNSRDLLMSVDVVVAGADFYPRLRESWFLGGLREPYPWESELLALYDHIEGLGLVCMEEWMERRRNGCASNRWPGVIVRAWDA